MNDTLSTLPYKFLSNQFFIQTSNKRIQSTQSTKVPLERINEQNSNSSESESPKYSEGNAKNDLLFCLCE